jgi:hypothetical protein
MNMPANPIITSRRGKIARLPQAVREELNTRLLNGEEAKTVLLWLNALPAVQEVIAAKFKNKPVVECNLSEWRKGGYMEWFLFHQMAPETRVGEVMDMTPEMTLAAQSGLTNKMAVMLFSHMVAQFKRLPLASDAEAEAKLWRELRLGLVALKRYEHISREEAREEARERAAIEAEEALKPKPKTPAQLEREREIILGLDPDRPKLNPKTDLFEGPGSGPLNEFRIKFKTAPEYAEIRKRLAAEDAQRAIRKQQRLEQYAINPQVAEDNMAASDLF